MTGPGFRSALLGFKAWRREPENLDSGDASDLLVGEIFFGRSTVVCRI